MLRQKLEWKASYTARKATERHERPNAVVPSAAAAPRPAVVSPGKPQEEGIRFTPGTVIAFSLGACSLAFVCDAELTACCAQARALGR